MKSDLVEIPCTVVAETEKVVLIDDGNKKVWLPKSQMEIQEDGNSLVAVMPERLAIEKGLI